jgi:hypothetical protein
MGRAGSPGGRTSFSPSAAASSDLALTKRLRHGSYAVPVIAIDPENRIIDATADGVGRTVLRKLHDPSEAEREMGFAALSGPTGPPDPASLRCRALG